MRIPITKYGLPQVIILPAIIIAIMVTAIFIPLPLAIFLLIEFILFFLFIWTLSFFRDPGRLVPEGKNLLLAPADGTISDIEIIEENDFLRSEAVRIGIFLSVFNVHINRAPCDVKVEKVIYKKGEFKDARNPRASQVNESNDLWLVKNNPPRDKLIVRQISGAIARRIVCAAKQGQNLKAGEKFGMIKFGSRTELYIPDRENVEILVKKGDKVKAGITVLARYGG